MNTPHFSESEAQAHQTFSGLMWALSYPGRPYLLAQRDLDAFAAIGAALLDLETSYFTTHAELGHLLARSGARAQPVEIAHYQFYPELTVEMLADLREAPIGSYTYPDASSTLVIGCALGSGQKLRLSGPGINTPLELFVGGLPPAFWEQRARACRFPLGWDILLVAQDQLVGLPRSTRIEVR